MAVRLRLARLGRKNRPFYRLNAVDSRVKRDGSVIEQLGHYNPVEKDPAKQIVVDLERAKYWLDNGAEPSETVSSLLKRSGMEHKQLKLPKPGKPKPAAEAEKKA